MAPTSELNIGTVPFTESASETLIASQKNFRTVVDSEVMRSGRGNNVNHVITKFHEKVEREKLPAYPFRLVELEGGEKVLVTEPVATSDEITQEKFGRHIQGGKAEAIIVSEYGVHHVSFENNQITHHGKAELFMNQVVAYQKFVTDMISLSSSEPKPVSFSPEVGQSYSVNVRALTLSNEDDKRIYTEHMRELVDTANKEVQTIVVALTDDDLSF